MHGRRGVLELEEGAVKVNVTFVPRASIDDATGKYCISQQGSLYQLGVPAADEALEAAAPAAAELSEEGGVEEGCLEKGGLQEKGRPELRGTVFDSCHWLRVDLNAYSALLDLDENEGSTESTQYKALATGAEKKASELALIFRGWRGVIRSQAAAKRKLGLRSAAMTRAMREAWRSMTTHSLRRGLSLVPLQAAWHRWRRGLAGAAKQAEAQRQRLLRTTLAAWKRRADGADVQLNVTWLEGQSAPLVLSRQATQAQLHAFLARLHKVAPRLFRLWWLKPDEGVASGARAGAGEAAGAPPPAASRSATADSQRARAAGTLALYTAFCSLVSATHSSASAFHSSPRPRVTAPRCCSSCCFTRAAFSCKKIV